MHTPEEGSPYSSSAPVSATPVPAAELATTELLEKHSGLGIAGLVLGLAAALVQGGSLALGIVAAMQKHSHDEHMNLVLGLVFCGGALLNLPGLGLGIAGLFQAKRRKGVAITAVALNATELLLILGMIALGVSQRS